jgi:hypothetical protein
VFQYNKRDLPNVDTVEDMNAYLTPAHHPVVEAAAIQGVGVTATLRAAIGVILENLKKNVDTTLYDQPALGAPDMSQRSGVTQGSAGTPKLSMRQEPAAPPEPEPEPIQVAVEALEEDPFGSYAPVEVEEVDAEAMSVDPFASAVAVAEPEPEPSVVDNPFATTAGIHDESHDRDELEKLLTSTRRVIASLEAALQAARESEQTLLRRLS